MKYRREDLHGLETGAIDFMFTIALCNCIRSKEMSISVWRRNTIQSVQNEINISSVIQHHYKPCQLLHTEQRSINIVLPSWLFKMGNCFWRQMSSQMCTSLCTLNYQSPVYKEYVTGPMASNNAVQNNSYQVGEGKAFFSLSNVSTFASIISQYHTLEK